MNVIFTGNQPPPPPPKWITYLGEIVYKTSDLSFELSDLHFLTPTLYFSFLVYLFPNFVV